LDDIVYVRPILFAACVCVIDRNYADFDGAERMIDLLLVPSKSMLKLNMCATVIRDNQCWAFLNLIGMSL